MITTLLLLLKTLRQPQLDVVRLPDTEYTPLPSLHIPSETDTSTRPKLFETDSFTKSKLYPPLKTLRKQSTSLSNLLESSSQEPDYIPSQESQSSILVPKHRYNLRPLHSRRLSTDSSTLDHSSLSSNSGLRLVSQHAQPISTDSTTTHSSDFVPRYFTSGIETSSLLSSDVQTAYLSGNVFSEVLIPNPAAPHVRNPECITSQHSRTPNPNFTDYPKRVDGATIYEPQADPRFTIFTERYNINNDTLSTKRNELELKRLPNSNLEFKFEGKVKLHCLKPHPVFQVAKLEHKTTPAPSIVTYIEFHRDSDLPDSVFGKFSFYNPYSGPYYTTSL